jgi:CelD/BcsL family acetyltransferase involved in cellulose biosynthesis
MAVRIAEGLAGLHSLKAEWERLHAAGGGGLFQSYAWMAAWATAIQGQALGDIRILTVEDRCIVPLFVQRRLGIRRLRWLGVEVTDYCDVIAAETSDGLDLAAAIRANLPPADIVELTQMRAGSLAARIFDASVQPGGQSCPYITIAGYTPPGDIIYAERRAAGAGGLDHDIATDEIERADIVDFVVAQKRQALLRRGIATTEYDRRVTPFLRSLATLDYSPGTRPFFSRLSLGGQPIAAQIGFVAGGTLFYYLPAFDHAYRQYSPGHLLLLKLVREAARLGLNTVDLLRGREQYKFKWTSTEQPLAAAERTVTWRGQAFAFARGLKRS